MSSQRFISTTRNFVDMRYVMSMYKPSSKNIYIDDVSIYTNTTQVRRELITLINKMYDCITQPPYSKHVFDNIKYAHEVEIKLNNQNLCTRQLIDMRNMLVERYKVL
jgi:hypothetical protein